MIEVKYFERKNRYAISAKGHAGYAPLGQDIVCAAVTSVLFALGNYVLDHFAEKEWIILEVKLDEGDVNVEILDDGSTGIAHDIYRLIFEQIKDLEEIYPLNIKTFENLPPKGCDN